jgi:NAD-dependent SIR2 family protein deacetylase
VTQLAFSIPELYLPIVNKYNVCDILDSIDKDGDQADVVIVTGVILKSHPFRYVYYLKVINKYKNNLSSRNEYELAEETVTKFYTRW